MSRRRLLIAIARLAHRHSLFCRRNYSVYPISTGGKVVFILRPSRIEQQICHCWKTMYDGLYLDCYIYCSISFFEYPQNIRNSQVFHIETPCISFQWFSREKSPKLAFFHDASGVWVYLSIMYHQWTPVMFFYTRASTKRLQDTTQLYTYCLNSFQPDLVHRSRPKVLFKYRIFDLPVFIKRQIITRSKPSIGADFQKHPPIQGCLPLKHRLVPLKVRRVAPLNHTTRNHLWRPAGKKHLVPILNIPPFYYIPTLADFAPITYREMHFL